MTNASCVTLYSRFFRSLRICDLKCRTIYSALPIDEIHDALATRKDVFTELFHYTLLEDIDHCIDIYPCDALSMNEVIRSSCVRNFRPVATQHKVREKRATTTIMADENANGYFDISQIRFLSQLMRCDLHCLGIRNPLLHPPCWIMNITQNAHTHI